MTWQTTVKNHTKWSSRDKIIQTTFGVLRFSCTLDCLLKALSHLDDLISICRGMKNLTNRPTVAYVE